MEELISVIIPVYNVENYIEKCLETLINQTYKKLEIILIDDGSSDNSGNICDKYQKEDSRIKVIHKKNEGASEARNVGIEQATGKYLAFVDADDYIDYTMLEKMYNQIKQDNAQIVFCGYSRINDIGIEKENFLDIEKYPKDKTILYSLIGALPNDKNDIIIGTSVWICLYDLNIIKSNNIFFKSQKIYMSEDILFQIEYLEHVKKVGLIKEPLYKYRYNENSLSTKYKKDRFEKQKVLYREEKRVLEEKGIYNKEVQTRLDRTFLMKIKSCIKGEVKMNNDKTKNKISNIKNMLNDDLVREVLKRYPIYKLPLESRILTYLMRYKQVHILYYIYKMKRSYR